MNVYEKYDKIFFLDLFFITKAHRIYRKQTARLATLPLTRISAAYIQQIEKGIAVEKSKLKLLRLPESEMKGKRKGEKILG